MISKQNTTPRHRLDIAHAHGMADNEQLPGPGSLCQKREMNAFASKARNGPRETIVEHA